MPYADKRHSAQVVDQLDRNSFKEMHRYVATDITAAFGPGLLRLVDNPRLEFKVTPVWAQANLRTMHGVVFKQTSCA